MPDEESAIFECVEGIAQYIGVDDKLKSAIVNILGLGGADSFDAASLETALKALLSQMVLQEQINDAAAKLADARGYYKDSYQTDIQQNDGDGQRLSDLQASRAVALDNLTLAGTNLGIWLTTSSEAGSQPKLAATAVPLWAAIWLHVCVYFSEVAKVSPEEVPDSQDPTKKDHPRANALEKMRNYARDNLAKIAPYLSALWQVRINAVSYDRETCNLRPDSGRGALFWYERATISDAWLDGDSTLICQLREEDAISTAWGAIIGPVWEWYRWALWNGDATVYDPAIGDQISTKDGLRRVVSVLMKDQSERWWGGGPDDIGDKNSWNSDFLLHSVQKVVDFGNWASGVRRQLLQLDLIASGLTTMKAEDGWSWCDQCGALFSVTRAQPCPANQMGPHGQQGSGNYVLRCDPVTPPPSNMQDGWRVCNRCGDLFWSGDPNANVCKSPIFPDDQWHDGTGSKNYVLGVGAVPKEDQRGLDVQPGWRWCNKCGVLHYYGDGSLTPPAPSQCVAGGQHATDRSGDYWLPSLGTLPRSRLVYTKWHP